MTGTEAISNGVPAFKPPESLNARTTLVVDGRAAGHDVPRHVVPRRTDWACCPPDDETVLSQIGRTVFGAGAAVGGAADRHRADPDPGRQHLVRRLSRA